MDYLIPYSDFLLPMGISFYTFQTLSYTIDVYNGKLKPEGNFSVFALYVSFFPQLVAGPIERAGNLIGQLRNLQSIVVNNFTSGMSRILMGLFKKLVIADRLALFVDPVFDNPEGYDGLLLIIAAIFFAFQIYCDFSGYSDMAIGIARIFGVRLVENFNSPYLAPNLSNFWGRWHISLNTWFIDYLYTPIALNRRHWAKYGVIFAIFITFTTSGLWHGANFTFIAWGFLHSVGLIYETLTKKRRKRWKKMVAKPIWTLGSIVVTFGFVCLTDIFFRANSVSDALYIISSVGNIDVFYVVDILYTFKSVLLEPNLWFNRLSFDFGSVVFQMTNGDFIMSLILIPTLLFVESRNLLEKIQLHSSARFFLFYLLAVSIILFGVLTEKQFIYFQF